MSAPSASRADERRTWRGPRLDPRLTDERIVGVAEQIPEVASPVARTKPNDYAPPRPLAEPAQRSPVVESFRPSSESAGTVRRLDEAPTQTGGGRKPPWLFLALVVLPALVTGLYLAFVAADRYTSEASYVLVKGGSPLTGGAAVPGVGRSDESSSAIVVFFGSRDATEHLAKDVDLQAKLMHPSADPLSAYPGLFYDDTREGLYEAMRDAVEVTIDSSTGISTLEVTAFTPQDAQELAAALLKEAEALVNRLNERAVNDSISFARNIVAENENRVRDVQQRMTDFRNTENLLDPNAQSTAELELMTQLTQQATSIDTELAQLRASAPKNPRLASLAEQRNALNDQIEQIRVGLAGNDDSLAPKISAYERLALERDLAVQALTHAYASLEEARQEAFANRLYLQTIAAPNLPDRPSYPEPVFWTLLVLAIGFAVYRIARIAIREAMEHTA
ncbi:hypothetical protein [Jiella pelagia]|uniref:Capsular polysaccharide transport system permease protein n=1 Tax=Jiella pelagia TaxID=2986949 RepID=A0ABY7C4A8_9HYPH|nr:hypothetical protein [Jiella pelagia]WAP70863.1 hypothetical protein OH818_13230 [Jiella pelagia]